MGLGSRFLNLFSPTKGSPDNNSNNNDDDDKKPPDGEQIQFSDNDDDPQPLNPTTTAHATSTTTTATSTAAANNNKSARNSNNQTPQKSTTVATKSSTTSSRKKKGHCNYPGCTRALFARGQCYRHDQETKHNGSSGRKSTPRASGGKKSTPRSNGSESSSGASVNEEGNNKQQRSSSGNDKKKKAASKQSKVKHVESTTTPSLSFAAKKTTSTTTTTTTTPLKKKKKKSSSSGLKHCNYPGCTRALFARGKCYRHDHEEQAQLRLEEDAEEKKKMAPSASSNMKSPSTSSSLSVGKKKKKKKKKKRKSSELESTTKKTKSGLLKHCSYPGCTRALFARGMCYRHDTEAKRRIESGEGGVGGASPVARGRRTPSPPKAAMKPIKKKREKKTLVAKAEAAAAASNEEQQTPSSSGKKRKKKGHCNYPGCTRALFARGKCYRHDHETRGISGSGTKKRSSSSRLDGKSNPKSAVPILPSLTKALTSSSSSSSRQKRSRKSAIARRPRQLKPTQKLLAMQEDALALYEDAAVGTGGKKKTTTTKKRKSGKKVSSNVNSGKQWECNRCTTLNPHSRNRCTSCQGWRGGKREGFSPPNNKKMRVGGGGSVSMEELTANTTTTCDEEDEESNYDNVVCCLCKCGVDFSDADFFLPEKDCNGQQHKLNGVEEVEYHSSLEGEDNALDDSKNGEVKKGNLKSVGLEDDDYPEKETNGDAKGNLNRENDITVGISDEGRNGGKDDDDTAENDEEKPPFQLPRRFHNPRNGLILCDGPAHAGKRRGGSSSNGQQHQTYQCERAYHQRCHFIPVFAVPRGPWRCLICRYRDQEYLKQKGKGGNNTMNDSDARIFTDQELNVMFRCNIPQPKDDTELLVGEEKKEEKAVITNVPPAMMSPSKSDIASLEHEFENVTGALKAKIMKEDLTTKAEKVINAALSNIRNSEHSLRSFTETSRSRKALAERIQNIGGLPQELTQCVMRIAQNKLRIKDLIVVLEESIRCAPHHVNTKSEDATGCIDAVSELMQWYLSQSSPEEAAHFNPDEMQNGKTLLQHLFPEGDLHRRRFEPRTGEARVQAEDASVKSDSSGVSLDDLKCSCCHGGAATDDNDMLLCDGIGCYRAFHMQCLEPKVTLEEVEAAGEDEAWFCPLCTAHANLVHYAQREYLLDDWEHDWDEIMRRRGHSEWETAEDVFPEAEVELRVAQKFKDGIKDDETTLFIRETFGIGGAAAGIESGAVDEDALAAQDDDDDDDEEDEDFDIDGPVEEGSDGNSSATEDMHEEKKLLKEKIGRDELDALSICSSSEESDSDASSYEDEGLRRSKRRRFTFPPSAATAKDGDSSGNDSKSKDMGALDTSNIVRGKRSRSKVDYRKLADTMFGDDSDEEAKGSVMKYDYKPKKAPVDESSDEDESSSDDDSESDDEDAHETKSQNGEE